MKELTFDIVNKLHARTSKLTKITIVYGVKTAIVDQLVSLFDDKSV